jgi:hypothetical protein
VHQLAAAVGNEHRHVQRLEVSVGTVSSPGDTFPAPWPAWLPDGLSGQIAPRDHQE